MGSAAIVGATLGALLLLFLRLCAALHKLDYGQRERIRPSSALWFLPSLDGPDREQDEVEADKMGLDLDSDDGANEGDAAEAKLVAAAKAAAAAAEGGGGGGPLQRELRSLRDRKRKAINRDRHARRARAHDRRMLRKAQRRAERRGRDPAKLTAAVHRQGLHFRPRRGGAADADDDGGLPLDPAAREAQEAARVLAKAQAAAAGVDVDDDSVVPDEVKGTLDLPGVYQACLPAVRMPDPLAKLLPKPDEGGEAKPPAPGEGPLRRGAVGAVWRMQLRAHHPLWSLLAAHHPHQSRLARAGALLAAVATSALVAAVLLDGYALLAPAGAAAGAPPGAPAGAYELGVGRVLLAAVAAALAGAAALVPFGAAVRWLGPSRGAQRRLRRKLARREGPCHVELGLLKEGGGSGGDDDGDGDGAAAGGGGAGSDDDGYESDAEAAAQARAKEKAAAARAKADAAAAKKAKKARGAGSGSDASASDCESIASDDEAFDYRPWWPEDPLRFVALDRIDRARLWVRSLHRRAGAAARRCLRRARAWRLPRLRGSHKVGALPGDGDDDYDDSEYGTPFSSRPASAAAFRSTQARRGSVLEQLTAVTASVIKKVQIDTAGEAATADDRDGDQASDDDDDRAIEFGSSNAPRMLKERAPDPLCERLERAVRCTRARKRRRRARALRAAERQAAARRAAATERRDVILARRLLEVRSRRAWDAWQAAHPGARYDAKRACLWARRREAARRAFRVKLRHERAVLQQLRGMSREQQEVRLLEEARVAGLRSWWERALYRLNGHAFARAPAVAGPPKKRPLLGGGGGAVAVAGLLPESSEEDERAAVVVDQHPGREHGTPPDRALTRILRQPPLRLRPPPALHPCGRLGSWLGRKLCCCYRDGAYGCRVRGASALRLLLLLWVGACAAYALLPPAALDAALLPLLPASAGAASGAGGAGGFARHRGAGAWGVAWAASLGGALLLWWGALSPLAVLLLRVLPPVLLARRLARVDVSKLRHCLERRRLLLEEAVQLATGYAEGEVPHLRASWAVAELEALPFPDDGEESSDDDILVPKLVLDKPEKGGGGVAGNSVNPLQRWVDWAVRDGVATSQFDYADIAHLKEQMPNLFHSALADRGAGGRRGAVPVTRRPGGQLAHRGMCAAAALWKATLDWEKYGERVETSTRAAKLGLRKYEREAARAEARVRRDENALDAARENLADEIEMAEMLGDEGGMEAEIKHTRRLATVAEAELREAEALLEEAQQAALDFKDAVEAGRGEALRVLGGFGEVKAACEAVMATVTAEAAAAAAAQAARAAHAALLSRQVAHAAWRQCEMATWEYALQVRVLSAYELPPVPPMGRLPGDDGRRRPYVVVRWDDGIFNKGEAGRTSAILSMQPVWTSDGKFLLPVPPDVTKCTLRIELYDRKVHSKIDPGSMGHFLGKVELSGSGLLPDRVPIEKEYFEIAPRNARPVRRPDPEDKEAMRAAREEREAPSKKGPGAGKLAIKAYYKVRCCCCFWWWCCCCCCCCCCC